MEVLSGILFVFVIIWVIMKWIWNHTLGWVLSKLLFLVVTFPKITLTLFVVLVVYSVLVSISVNEYRAWCLNLRRELFKTNQRIVDLENELSREKSLYEKHDSEWPQD